MDASTLHPECTLGRQTPVCRQLGHEAAFRADQGLRTRHGHRRLGNVVLSASLSGGRQWPTTVCCGHLSQMDTPLGTLLLLRAARSTASRHCVGHDSSPPSLRERKELLEFKPGLPATDAVTHLAIHSLPLHPPLQLLECPPPFHSPPLPTCTGSANEFLTEFLRTLPITLRVSRFVPRQLQLHVTAIRCDRLRGNLELLSHFRTRQFASPCLKQLFKGCFFLSIQPAGCAGGFPTPGISQTLTPHLLADGILAAACQQSRPYNLSGAQSIAVRVVTQRADLSHCPQPQASL